MSKLLTEDTVRRMFKQRELLDKGSLTLPRGTILTPSARSFLAEHQIKLKTGINLNISDSFTNPKKHNLWLDTLTINQPPINFEQISYYRMPLSQLRSALREQGILFLLLLKDQQEDLNQDVVTHIVQIINTLLAVTSGKLNNIEDLPWNEAQTSELKLEQANKLTLQLMLISVEKIAICISNYLAIQPDFNKTVFYQAIIKLETMMQALIQSSEEAGEK